MTSGPLCILSLEFIRHINKKMVYDNVVSNGLMQALEWPELLRQHIIPNLLIFFP